jgi:ribosome-binding protein aMBF1 (putative translation factor)
MKSDGKNAKNALSIMKRRYYKTEARRADLEEARINAQAARLIYQLRTDANLSQKQLADLVGTTQSVISRLEDDDYDGHSLSMLGRITAAVQKRLVLTAVEA